MRENDQYVIRKLATGFETNEVNRDIGTNPVHAFTTFREVCQFIGKALDVENKKVNPDGSVNVGYDIEYHPVSKQDPRYFGMSREAARDELGELRRYKEYAEQVKEENRQTIAQLTQNLECQRNRSREQNETIQKLREKIEQLEAPKLVAEPKKSSKKSRRRVKK